MPILYCDTETFSPVHITHGVHAYAEKAEVMLFAYALDDSAVGVWDFTDPTRNKDDFKYLLQMIHEADQIVFHNLQFDRTVIKHALGIDLPMERCHCTMAQALAHGLPGALDKLCEVFKVPVEQSKGKSGKQLINLFCKPRPKTSKVERATRVTHPKEWAEFIEYARLDIEAMRVLHRKMPGWNLQGRELGIWHLDSTINTRGVAVDRSLASAAIDAVELEQRRLALKTQDLTDGAVSSATRRDVMLAHILQAYGITLPDMQMATIERRIADPEIPESLRELLRTRLSATTSSTAKYKTLMNAVSSDGRLRGTLQYCGASRTGRWAGRLFQPQNLPRPSLKQKEIEYGIAALKGGYADVACRDIMQLTSSCIRGCLVAAEGKKLVVSDLSNIEGRVAAWLCGENWKLKAFAAYDAGTGPDLYKLAYARAFGIAVQEVTKDQRQIGKVMELMLQYEGGVGAFLTGAATYGIDLDAMAVTAWPSIPPHIRKEAEGMWQWAVKKRSTFDLKQKTFIVCDSLKRMWREAQPAIAGSWDLLKTATEMAISSSGHDFKWNKCTFRRDGAWLRIILPSGRSLCYASPQVGDGKITYLGINQYSRKWDRLGTYGGKLFENITQAVARDVMAWNMLAIDEAGYKIVLSVHDEVITEAPDSKKFSAEGLSKLLSANPAWAPDLPLSAGGFEGPRYKKED